MKKILFLVSILNFSIGMLYAQNPELKVFILAGQSNMAGSFLPLVSELPNYLLDSVPNVLIKVNGSVNYNWGALRPGLGATTSNFGPEITFGHDMLAFFKNKKIALIKYSVDGTNLDQSWRPPSSGGTTGDLYTALKNEIKSDIKYLQKSYDVEIVGMCWMQGESDATDSTMAANYELNLTNFIHDLRQDIAAPNMQFVIGMIDNSALWPYNALVRQAESNVAQHNNKVSIFDTHGLETDGYHYKTQGQIQLGHLFANSIIQSQLYASGLLKRDFKLTPNPCIDTITINGLKIINGKAEIFTIDGKKMMTCILNNNIIDIQSLPQGLYFLSIIGKEEVILDSFVKE